jgi:hypothetical protein
MFGRLTSMAAGSGKCHDVYMTNNNWLLVITSDITYGCDEMGKLNLSPSRMLGRLTLMAAGWDESNTMTSNKLCNRSAARCDVMGQLNLRPSRILGRLTLTAAGCDKSNTMTSNE